jgi:hypothetical protein
VRRNRFRGIDAGGPKSLKIRALGGGGTRAGAGEKSPTRREQREEISEHDFLLCPPPLSSLS